MFTARLQPPRLGRKQGPTDLWHLPASTLWHRDNPLLSLRHFRPQRARFSAKVCWVFVEHAAAKLTKPDLGPKPGAVWTEEGGGGFATPRSGACRLSAGQCIRAATEAACQRKRLGLSLAGAACGATSRGDGHPPIQGAPTRSNTRPSPSWPWLACPQLQEPSATVLVRSGWGSRGRLDITLARSAGRVRLVWRLPIRWSHVARY